MILNKNNNNYDKKKIRKGIGTNSRKFGIWYVSDESFFGGYFTS
jgi:hypothetical protein